MNIQSLTPNQLILLMKKGIEGALYPPHIRVKHKAFSAQFWNKNKEEITLLLQTYKNEINDLINTILNSESEKNTFELLSALDPLKAVLYEERLDTAVVFLDEGLEPLSQIEIPQTWTELLKILLLRK